MTKIREASSCAEVLWEAVRAIGHGKLGGDVSAEAARAEGISEVARVLGLDKGTVRNILNPDRPEQMSLERAAVLSRAFGIDLFARWLALESNGLFVPLPSPTGDIEKLTAAGVRQVGETAAEVIEALGATSEGGKAISEREAQQLRTDAAKVAEIFMKISGLADSALRRLKREVRK